ncbi:NTP transferase domain-containing protein [Methanoplanus sp. FWC-SCC4]|uniref:NTP transferase domain-containing protein n=1 Tax=Methanochimaera problematica TaxID=2609417 RepID=A0AA97I2U7_9EURY|nr:NTP transferase domain-containing protein [Methanoplanus sp. FWC-SCC4]WOF15973.1 NTP transferase domain-containing protein [Methanoplanus sp. FWC-SCC4]
MLSVIMAGGKGSRLSLGEKPLVKIAGTPMLSYVISAFQRANCDILVIASPAVPMTINWCRANGIDYYKSRGTGYVEDLIECITETGEKSPFFSCVSDLPGIKPLHIEYVWEKYLMSGKEACSVWVPRSLFLSNGCTCSYSEEIDGINACPVGLNILNGENIENEQKEYKIVLNESSLAYNINTKEDFEKVSLYFD